MYSIGELRVGQYIEHENFPFLITFFQHSKQARGGGVAKTKLRNLVTGATIDKTFQGSEKIKPADIGYSKAQYLYEDQDGFHFMNNESFEQFSFETEAIGDSRGYLIEGENYDIQNWNDSPINVNFPPNVTLEVAESEPGVKGDTASSPSKSATLKTGIKIQVPLFINEGDLVRVDTRTGEYLERVAK